MAKLEDYLRYNNNEIAAIKDWAQREHKEKELLELIPLLSAMALGRVERENDYIKTWSLNCVDMSLVDGVEKDEAHLYNRLFQWVITRGEPNEDLIKELAPYVSNRDIPLAFFRPAMVWMADQGLRFKDDNEVYDETCSIRRPKF